MSDEMAERIKAMGHRIIDALHDPASKEDGFDLSDASISLTEGQGGHVHRYLPSKGCTWKCACGDSFLVHVRCMCSSRAECKCNPPPTRCVCGATLYEAARRRPRRQP